MAPVKTGALIRALRKHGYVNETGFPEIRYRFLQWGLDSGGAPHDGYFWYNCENGAVDALPELNGTAKAGSGTLSRLFPFQKPVLPENVVA